MTTAAFATNRDRILRVSADLFARNGYHGTGINELSPANGATGSSRPASATRDIGGRPLWFEPSRPISPDEFLDALLGGIGWVRP